MSINNEERTAVSRSQELEYGKDHDYTINPHIRHAGVRGLIETNIRVAIDAVLSRQESCEVLEVGAGHGTFTETVLRAGGKATLTEMSKASFDYLERKFGDRPEVNVVYDTDGQAPLRAATKFDVILLISVIHHIPDYINAVKGLCDNALRPEGIVVAFQDPLWYPRQSKLAMFLSWGSYFAWRVMQGQFKRGLKTRWRRLRGIYDESEPSDLVEYHVVRQGVDEQALLELFRQRFADVEMFTYFSTTSPLLQSIGAKRFPHNTFGIVARGRSSM